MDRYGGYDNAWSEDRFRCSDRFKALVAKDVEPYSIVGGNPAREIRKRFTDKEIEMLLEIKWWEWDVEIIDNYMEYICSGNIEGLYGRFKLMEKN